MKNCSFLHPKFLLLKSHLIFNSLLSVSSGDEKLHLMLDILPPMHLLKKSLKNFFSIGNNLILLSALVTFIFV